MKHSSTKLLACLLLLLASLTVRATPKGHPATEALIYKVSGPQLDQPSYLFLNPGTLASDELELVPGLEKCLGEVSGLVLPTSNQRVDDATVMQMVSMRGTSWSDLIPEADLDRVRKMVKEHARMPWILLARFQPMMAMVDLQAGMEEEYLGKPKPMRRLEEGLESKVRQAGGEVNYLMAKEALMRQLIDEGEVAAQAKLLVSLSMEFDGYRKVLKKYAQRAEKGRHLAAWEAVAEYFASDPDRAFFLNKLNTIPQSYLQSMPEYLARGNQLIVVGIRYAAGDAGVLKQLEAAGYILEPVEL